MISFPELFICMKWIESEFINIKNSIIIVVQKEGIPFYWILITILAKIHSIEASESKTKVGFGNRFL